MSLVEHYMSMGMVTRSSKDSILNISRAMSDSRVSSIAMTEDTRNTRVVGILTERDIVGGIARGLDPTMVAESLMSTPVLSIRKDQPIEEAAHVMVRAKVRHLLVEDPGHGIIGMITTTDLARYLKHRTQNQNMNEKERPSSQFVSEVLELISTSFSPKDEAVRILNSEVVVPAGGYILYTFSTAKDAMNVRLKGDYTSDGTGLHVHVVDQTILDLWKEGTQIFSDTREGCVYYTTHDMHKGIVDVVLYEMYGSVRGETLYLIFDNKDDKEHLKHVNANFELTYTRYVTG